MLPKYRFKVVMEVWQLSQLWEGIWFELNNQKEHVMCVGWCVLSLGRAFTTSARVFYLVTDYYLISSNLKFRKHPSCCWGDIPLLLILYDLKVRILGFFHPELSKKVKRKSSYFLGHLLVLILVYNFYKIKIWKMQKMACISVENWAPRSK